MENSNCCTNNSNEESNSNCSSTNSEEKEIYTINNFAKSNPNYLKSMFGQTDLMPMWIADMDFKVAEPITNELQRLVDRGNFAYEFNATKVFNALVDWNARRHNLKLESKSFIQVTGVLTGIGVLIRELSNEGDGVLIQTPVYHQFFKVIEAASRVVIDNPLIFDGNNYQMDFVGLELKLQTKKVKIILLCNPHNPIGRVWRKKELQKLIELANKYQVRIISDEIHSDIIYLNAKFNSIASFAESTNHIAVLGSPAKTFGMQSISNGYLYIPNGQIYKRIKENIAALYLDHGNALSTYATLAAYSKGEEWLNDKVTYFEHTVRWVQKYIEKELTEIKLIRPEGTYQLWLDFSQLNLTEEALLQLIVHNAKLALTPGTWFGANGKQFMRMNIGSPLAKIQKAFYQIKTAIKQDLNSVRNIRKPESTNCCGC